MYYHKRCVKRELVENFVNLIFIENMDDCYRTRLVNYLVRLYNGNEIEFSIKKLNSIVSYQYFYVEGG